MRVNAEKKLNQGPDSLYPNGVLHDNNSSMELIETLEAELGNYSLLDLGCAGGQWIVDNHSAGHVAIGIDGSDYPIKSVDARGHLNWTTYHKDILWNADISYPFQVKDTNGDVQFDVVTSWETLEHIPAESLDTCLQNIEKHMKPDGIFLATISTVSGEYQGVQYHSSIFDRNEWINNILGKYFIVEKYPYRGCPRLDAAPHLDLTSDQSIAVICRKRK